MYGVIYVDVLVLVNTIAGWFMLRCAAAFARRTQRPARMLTAAVTAGFSSLVILLPPLPAVAATAIKLALAGAVVRIAFPFENARVFAKSCAAFFAANMLCAAAAFAAVQAGVRGVSANNGMVYIRVSPVLLILCILGVYAAVEGWDFLFGSGAAKSLRSFQAVVMGTTLSGTALLDLSLIHILFWNVPVFLRILSFGLAHPLLCVLLVSSLVGAYRFIFHFKKGDR